MSHPPVFEDVALAEQYYQTSSFFPMPVVLVSTRAEDGQTNLAPYSLVFPRVEPGRHLLELVCMKGTKTSANLLRDGRAALAFVTDDSRTLEGCRALGRARPTADKMAQSIFELVDSPQGEGHPPLVLEAVQVFECRLERAVEHDVFKKSYRFVLEVEHVRMKPQWAAALRRGDATPNLAIDYGFRQTTSSWLVRSSTRMAKARLRPRYQVSVGVPVDELLQRLGSALEALGSGVEGELAGRNASIHIPEAERHFWSPHLDVDLVPAGDGTTVHARIGPHPHVWTMFMALHAVLAFTGVAGAIYGLVQWTLDQSPWALLALPVALGLNAFVAGAAFIGQGLGADHIYRLRAFLDDVLAS